MKVCCCLKARRESELAKSKMQPNSAHKVGEVLADHKVGVKILQIIAMVWEIAIMVTTN